MEEVNSCSSCNNKSNNSSIRLSVDETNGQNGVLSNPSPGHHAQAPGEDTSSAANGEILPQLPTAQDMSTLKAKLYSFAVTDKSHEAISIFNAHRDMLHTPLTDNGDRILHIAVSANSINFVQQLVNGWYMTPQDLEIQNNDGNTAFCVAAISGNATTLQIMMNKNENLPAISGQDGMLPVHLAASSGHHEIVRLLSSDNLLLEMKYNDIERLFLMTISSDIFDVALKLFEKYRNLLARARADEKLTALRILARKPFEFSSVDSAGVKLFKEVWRHFRQLEYNEMLDPMDKPSTVLFDTIKSGNDVAARLILDMNPELLTLKDSDGRSPLHSAVFYRRESVLRYILEQRTVNLIIRAVDSQCNNVLHLAAASHKSQEELSRLDIKLQRELAWFKEVEERLPTELRTMKNSKGQTPEDMFYANKRELSKQVIKITKEIADSGMLVATLIATVAFAAALTGPGDKTSAWFVVFILTNTVALFASSAYVISFLSIFASPWFTENEFIFFSPTLIKLGLVLLLVAVVTMVLSFAAGIFLIFGHNHIFQWVPYVVVSMGVLPLPILLLLVRRSKYADRLLNYFRSKY